MKKKIHLIIILLFVCAGSSVFAQDRFAIIEQKLIDLSKTVPGLNEKVDLSINGAPLNEFIRAIGTKNYINVNVDPSLDMKVVNNFKNVNAIDIFMFLAKRYDLDIAFIGPILSFSKYIPPVVPIKIVQRKINVNYEKTADLLSYDLSNDTLSAVTKEITKLSGKNIIFSSDLVNKLVSGYIQSTTLASALEKLAFSNDLKVTQTPDGQFILEKKTANAEKEGKSAFSNSGGSKSKNIIIKDGLINVDVQNMAISDILTTVSNELKLDFYLFNEIKGNATLKVSDAAYDDFLKYLFNGTDYTFKKEGAIYLFGDRNLEGLRQSKLIVLKNRTIDKVIDYIPADLKKGVDVKVFEDLNGLIVSGSQPRINEMEAFLRQIDLIVPLVHIEVIIADVRKSKTLSAGITAGLADKAKTTSGTVLPNYEFTLSSSSINNLISGINGLGIINLGSVTPNFYMTLKALEEQGALKLRSTPQIATLNGHEAKISIGNTEYYLEVQNNIVNNVTNTNNILQSQNYKPVNADLSITIDPQVSGDEQITMSINVKQSSFTERISNTAPPGSINRDFASLIRVKNGEMIMLGGLEETNDSHTGSGLPFLSRIPVLKWFFGNNTRKKAENKLTIFIKPTIIYG